MSCLIVKSGGIENLLDVTAEYGIVGFYRAGLNQLKFYRTKHVSKRLAFGSPHRSGISHLD